MKLQFIGTGAADFDWSKYGEPGIKGSTSTLLDDHILIDCGTTVSKALKRFNIQSTDITAIVITHNHSDHFNIDVLKEMTLSKEVCLYGSKEVCDDYVDLYTFVNDKSLQNSYRSNHCSHNAKCIQCTEQQSNHDP